MHGHGGSGRHALCARRRCSTNGKPAIRSAATRSGSAPRASTWSRFAPPSRRSSSARPPGRSSSRCRIRRSPPPARSRTRDTARMKVQATIVISYRADSFGDAGDALDDLLQRAREREDVEIDNIQLATPASAGPVSLPYVERPPPRRRECRTRCPTASATDRRYNSGTTAKNTGPPAPKLPSLPLRATTGSALRGRGICCAGADRRAGA
jgi:hypothetical protein